MFRALSLVLLIALSAPSVGLAAQACRPGPDEISDSPLHGLRPTPTMRCAYDLADFQRRLDRLAAVRAGTLGVETVEALLGLSTMTTLYDDPRAAAYRVRLDGEGGWAAYVSIDETFYGGPARFAGTARPRRLHPQQRGQMAFDVLIAQPNPYSRKPEPGGCRSAGNFVDALRRAGWREEPFAPFVTDGATAPAGFSRRGGMGLGLNGVPNAGPHYSPAELEGACLSQFRLTQTARTVRASPSGAGKTVKPR